jgi:hypothetical protein
MAWDKRMVNSHRMINFQALYLTYVAGLCFSVPAGVKTPPSLRNVRPSYLHFTMVLTPRSKIYAELKTEYPEFEVPNHG